MEDGPVLVVDRTDYLYFAERAVRGMAAIVTELGDERACSAPELPGANTPYGLLTHCLGVMAYWGGHVVAGRAVQRDRPGEFTATGTVAELAERVEAALRQLRRDLEEVEPVGAPRREPDPSALGPERRLTQSTALLHLLEELMQHHGQLEVLRDALSAPSRDVRGADVRSPDLPSPDVSAPADSFADLPLEWLRAKRSVKWHRPHPDLLPAWVADMDFPVAPAIRAAIADTVERGDLGYPDWPQHPLAGPFAERMLQRYGWSPDPGQVRGVTDLIQALQIVLILATRPGDGVVAHVPNYPPFLATIRAMDRTLIPATLVPEGASSWTWDEDGLEAELSGGRARVLLLVNPHNPTGRVFTAPELRSVADLAERHDLTVVSDEIHAELTHQPQRHIPFASLGTAAAARTVTVTSATKAFNIAGLRTAVAHVGPAELRAAWDTQPPDLYGAANVLGVEATLAAWQHGDGWLARLNDRLLANRDHLADRLRSMPAVDLRPPEAGYLAWLDCAVAALPEEPASWFRSWAGVELSAGADFGAQPGRYARLNFATTTAVLDEIVDRLGTALDRRAAGQSGGGEPPAPPVRAAPGGSWAPPPTR